MFDNYAVYMGNDLGAVCTREETKFRVWAPEAEAVMLNLYHGGEGAYSLDVIPMRRDMGGTWFVKQIGDLHGVYYTYSVQNYGIRQETQDPYAKAAGANGFKSMVVDLSRTNPKDFEKDRGPRLKQKTDAVICEISVRDMTGDESCGVKYPGKYLGLAQSGTVNRKGQPTGLDYLKELGVTHVQVMPVYDFGSVDEEHPEVLQYNWGYDPVNYNVPEGSYSTNPYAGEVRIRELKEMIAAFHRAGIGVIMDVVYNHTYNVEDSCFQKCVPDYFYRKNNEGYSNASGCGNEIASERCMVRKYIIDSVLYWMKEYHMDGFRFDLMGVLDIETMQAVREAVNRIDPEILIYGEGWTGGDSVLHYQKRALKCNTRCMQGIGMFSDDIRDTLKGSVFQDKGTGYINGSPEKAKDLWFSVAGAVYHPQVDYGNDEFTPFRPWAATPADTINYLSCHDNLTLWDKLAVSAEESTEEERMAMNRLGAAVLMTSQGIPFFLCGEDFARSKPLPQGGFSENSYNLPLEVNGLKYGNLMKYQKLHEYYKGLIAFRKSHRLLRMNSAKQIRENIRFIPTEDDTVQFEISEKEEHMFIVYNPNEFPSEVTLPDKEEWKVYIKDDAAGTEVLDIIRNQIRVSAKSCLVCTRMNSRQKWFSF